MKLHELFPSRPVLTDGAWGTELQKRGLGPGECPDPWNLRHPDRVAEVARAYVEAGSQVILTNTFRANRVTLAEYGLAGETEAINRAGVTISRAAAAGRARVFASIGPTGKMLAAGEVAEDAVRDAFAEQAGALAEAGADALLIETMSDPGEAVLALQGARRTGLPVVVSFTFDAGRNKDRTMTGATPETAARMAEQEGADGIGANCGLGIADYVPICRRLRAATPLPLWIKPNAGLPEMEDGRTIYRVTAEAFAARAPALVDAGAEFVGGCCGSTPEFIRACAGALAGICGSS